jgi:hypothetical protein
LTGLVAHDEASAVAFFHCLGRRETAGWRHGRAQVFLAQTHKIPALRHFVDKYRESIRFCDEKSVSARVALLKTNENPE